MSSENHITIREWELSDGAQLLTELLHLAYKKQADRGLRYLASYQSLDITLQRIREGTCFVAVKDGIYIGTITYYSPEQVSGCKWYDRNDVASYGQFAVHPRVQSKGLGSKMIELVEDIARKEGAAEIAIDTAESALDLISFYKNRNYREVDRVQWKETNYQSVILSKQLSA
jgi:GNAT superfamily N-acetyltransferase